MQNPSRLNTLAVLQARGFDRSYRSGKYVEVQCSQCEAIVINGVPCHESSCPNEVHECHGCNTLIPARQRYCAECC